jgi:hypothetical protein
MMQTAAQNPDAFIELMISASFLKGNCSGSPTMEPQLTGE